MPTYEYVCSKCEQQFDISQSIAEKPLKVCPKDKCGLERWGKGRVKRAIVSGAGIIFKGSGFYSTDYRSEGYKAAAKKDSAAAAPPAGGDAKPAAKTNTESKPKSESGAAGPKADGK